MISKKEKEVLNLMVKHLDKVEECVKTATKTVETYLKGDISKAEPLARRVEEIKTEADSVQYDICDKLHKGAFFPFLRGDIYIIVRRVNKVADAAGACCEFFLGQRPEIPENLKDPLIRVTRESFSIIDPLKEGLLSYLTGDGEIINIVREKAKQVRIKESDVDKIERDLMREIFSLPLDLCHKLHLKLYLGTIMKVSDQSLKAARELELITMKSRV